MNKWNTLNRSKTSMRDAENLSRKLSDRRYVADSASFTCPSCESKVGMKDLIERKGSFGCVNCVR